MLCGQVALLCFWKDEGQTQGKAPLRFLAIFPSRCRWTSRWSGWQFKLVHDCFLHIHGLCLEQLRKTSKNLSTAGVPQRFKRGTLQIQVTSVTAKANLLFVAVGRLVPFFCWLNAIYKTYGESSLPRYVSHLMLFKDNFSCKFWIRGQP